MPIYVSGFQPLMCLRRPTWAFGPGWYVSRLWRLSADEQQSAFMEKVPDGRGLFSLTHLF